MVSFTFSDKSCLKGIRKRVIEPDPWPLLLVSECVCTGAHRYIHIHTNYMQTQGLNILELYFRNKLQE